MTKPIPPGAEIVTRKGERFARWRDRHGNVRTAKIIVVSKGKRIGQERIEVVSTFYFARYRDHDRRMKIAPTGCRDETAARQELANLQRRVELIRSGVIKTIEASVGNHQATPLPDHITAFLAHLDAAGVTKEHRAN